MKKVKLIKSFADYPVWEYTMIDSIEDNRHGYYANNLYWRPPNRDVIHPDIVERFKDHFANIKEPTLWEVCWDIFVEKWRTKKAFIDIVDGQEWGKKFEGSSLKHSTWLYTYKVI